MFKIYVGTIKINKTGSFKNKFRKGRANKSLIIANGGIEKEEY